MNVALSELPKFESLPHDERGLIAMQNAIDICPSIDYIRRAYDDAKQFGWSKQPVISMCIPSLLDDSLAPAGCHVMSLFCQHFRRELPDGRSWDDVKEAVADQVVDTVTHYAPNFRQSIVGRQINSPLDIERKLNMVGGDIFHGALHLDQIFLCARHLSSLIIVCQLMAFTFVALVRIRAAESAAYRVETPRV